MCKTCWANYQYKINTNMMKGDSYDSVVAFVEDCLVKDKGGMCFGLL